MKRIIKCEGHRRPLIRIEANARINTISIINHNYTHDGSQLPYLCNIISFLLFIYWGTRWRNCWGTVLQTGRSRVRFPMLSLEFFINIFLLVALWPWGRHSLSQKWVQGIFSGGKGGRCVGLTTLPPSCADCLKIWEPQSSGTLRACQHLYWDCFTFYYLFTGLRSCNVYFWLERLYELGMVTGI
jgi:hypothetical protein